MKQSPPPYYEKYLKYKIKYSELKKQLGGIKDIDVIQKRCTDKSYSRCIIPFNGCKWDKNSNFDISEQINESNPKGWCELDDCMGKSKILFNKHCEWDNSKQLFDTSKTVGCVPYGDKVTL